MLQDFSLRARMRIIMFMVCALFCIAAALALFGSHLSQQKFSQHIDQEQIARYSITKLYANGLQMGQALRNILLDPSHPQAYKNYDKAHEVFEKELNVLKKVGESLPRAEQEWQEINRLFNAQHAQHEPLMALIKQGELQQAQQFLNQKETPKWRELRSYLLDSIQRYDQDIEQIRQQLEQDIQRWQQLALLFMALAILVGIVLGRWLVRHVLAQVGTEPRKAARIVHTIAAGDLTQPIPDTNAESVLTAVQHMQSHLKDLISRIRSHAKALAQQVEQADQQSVVLADTARQQSDAAQAMAAEVEQLSVAITEVAENAQKAREKVDDAGHIAAENGAVIQKSSQEMQSIAQQIRTTADVITELSEASNQISHIVAMIKEVAEQTNLLALNASIEAARAGESGRGFAVVADEVRKLAERTHAATGDIVNTISAMQQRSQTAVQHMEETVNQVEHGVTLSSQASQAFAHIHTDVMQILQLVAGISHALQEQRSVSQSIANHVETISNMSVNTSAAVSESAQAMHQLHGLADDMRQSVNAFKVH